MGGNLSGPAQGKSPVFMVQAAKDPDSGNLDRIQIVKGWLDASGKQHERIYNVAWSGQRKLHKSGKLPAVGNTVHIKQATYSNSIGETQLASVWRDPDFQPAQHAFYYARVLEIPTPRWSTRDAAMLGVNVPQGLATSIAERAFTSPIWYTP